MAKQWDPAQAEALINRYANLQGPLLPILHALQTEFGCIPEPATPLIADVLNLSRAEVHGVISFYHDFRREPVGRVVVKLCRAEACQAMGGREAGEALLKQLGIGWGETTKDGAVTIEPVYCLGLCSVAPAALIDGEPAARFNAAEIVARVEAAR